MGFTFESEGDTVTLTLGEHDFSRVMLALYHLAQSGGPVIDPDGEAYHLTDVGMQDLIELYNGLDEHATSFFIDRQAATAAEVVKDG